MVSEIQPDRILILLDLRASWYLSFSSSRALRTETILIAVLR